MTMDGGERRIDEEVRHHLDELEAQLRARGMDPAEASREARRRFGDPDRVARQTLAAGEAPGRGLRGGWWGDVLQAVRGLRRAPSFTAAVVATLALALGATVAVFTVVHGVLLRPLPFEAPDRLVSLLEVHDPTGTDASPTSRGTFQDWAAGLDAVQGLAAWEWRSATLEDPERPEELLAVSVNPAFFDVLGVEMARGRGFVGDDAPVDAAATVVVLGWELWQRRFGGDPAAVGRTVPIDGVDREVVGIMPPRPVIPGPEAQLVLPSRLVPADATNRGGRVVNVVARLAPGATPAQVDGRVRALTETIARTYPTSARGWSARALPLREHLVGDVRQPLLVTFAAVALLLLVAGFNVAHLLLVRAADGARELAVRAALGAGRARLVRIRLAESLVLGVAGGVGGIGLAFGLRRGLTVLEPGMLPPLGGVGETSLPPAVLVFAMALAVVAGVAVGVWPALRSAEAAVSDVARGTAGARAAGTGGWGRRALVALQLAVTVVLLVGAGLLIRTVQALRAVDPGFEPEGVVAARISMDPRRYPEGTETRVYQQELLERVRALPGVEAAGITSALPMDPVSANFDLPTRSDLQEGVEAGELPQADFRIVGDGLMEALRYRLLAGRFLTGADGPDGALVGVVNRSFARLFWPDLEPEDVVGRRFQMPWTWHRGWHEVVGVVADTRFYGPAEATRPEMFIPTRQISWGFFTVVARTSGDPAAAEAALEEAVARADPLMPAQDVFRVSTLVEDAVASERFYALLLSGFAVLALALAAAGVYGVLAYLVRLRRRELGVRLALGASRGEVLGMVLRSGVGLALLGIVAGLAATLPATRFVRGMLFGVDPVDPATVIAVVALLAGVAGAACLLPAWRAARLDPVRILRDE